MSAQFTEKQSTSI
jgi:hypothetical protein